MLKLFKNPLFIYVIISVPIIIFLIISVLEKNDEEVFEYILTKDDIAVNKSEEATVEGWAQNNIISVDVKKEGEYEYSFDGGYTWQKENSFVALENGTLNILIKNKNGISENIEYKVTKVDSVKPVISFNLNKTIYVGDKIDLSEYISAVDYLSGLSGSVEITPKVLDTKKAGSVDVICSVKDKVNNIETITFKVDILNKPNNKVENDKIEDGIDKDDKKEFITMYRYRSINDIEYSCSEFDCSYLDRMDSKDLEKKYKSTNKCDDSLNIKQTFSNGCIIRPVDISLNCTQAFTTVDRYYESGDMVYDIYALSKEGKQMKMGSVGGHISNNASNYNSINNEGNTILDSSSSNKDKYKTGPCATDEVELYGYCHAICSYVENVCPSGYKKDGDKCYKYIEKTCNNTCTKTVMSDWSEWTTTKISESDKIQVQTKIVEK